MTIDAAWADLQVRSTDMLVVSGGEPMLQQRQLSPLLRLAFEAGWCTEIETAGTIAPQPDVVGLVTRFNVSPKLANSGNELDERYDPRCWRRSRFQAKPPGGLSRAPSPT
jgi:organic radical activating enzyme